MNILHKHKYKGLAKKDLRWTLVFNTIIAGLLTYIYQDDPFWVYLIISQCIGLSIATLCRCSLAVLKPQTTLTIAATLTAAIILGGLAGGLIGGWLSGHTLAVSLGKEVYTLRVVVLSLLFGGIASFYYFSREEIAATQQLLQQERIQRLTSEKQVVQSQLKMLQAQIEPHFLFNTLSTILSLLDTEVDKGKAMLKDLTRYLRASLAGTRSDWNTLGSEMELISAYLNILKVRMGDRLRVQIELDHALNSTPFAPMLIQPLVENAVIHGLDATIDGGTLAIHAEQEHGIMRITVADTGKGLDANHSQGVGLANIRDRLNVLYSDQGRLILTENQPSGVKAIIEVPYAHTH